MVTKLGGVVGVANRGEKVAREDKCRWREGAVTGKEATESVSDCRHVKPDIREENKHCFTVCCLRLSQQGAGLGTSLRRATKEVDVAKICSRGLARLSRGETQGHDVEDRIVVPALGQHKAILCVEASVELGLGKVDLDHTTGVFQGECSMGGLGEHAKNNDVVKAVGCSEQELHRFELVPLGRCCFPSVRLRVIKKVMSCCSLVQHGVSDKMTHYEGFSSRSSSPIGEDKSFTLSRCQQLRFFATTHLEQGL